jgi:hypothetical protein
MSDHAPELVEWPPITHDRPWGGVKDILYGSVRPSPLQTTRSLLGPR